MMVADKHKDNAKRIYEQYIKNDVSDSQYVSMVDPVCMRACVCVCVCVCAFVYACVCIFVKR